MLYVTEMRKKGGNPNLTIRYSGLR